MLNELSNIFRRFWVLLIAQMLKNKLRKEIIWFSRQILVLRDGAGAASDVGLMQWKST